MQQGFDMSAETWLFDRAMEEQRIRTVGFKTLQPNAVNHTDASQSK